MSLDHEMLLTQVRNTIIKIKNARTSLRNNQQIICNERLQAATDMLVHMGRTIEKDRDESDTDKEVQEARGVKG